MSDTAETCPQCGFGIKTHFDKVRLEESNRLRREELRKQDEVEQRRAEAERDANRELRMKYVTVPTRKPIINGTLQLAILSLCFGCAFIFAAIISFLDNNGPFLYFGCIGALLAFLGLGGIIDGRERLKEEQKIFERYANDPERYKKAIVERNDRRKRESELRTIEENDKARGRKDRADEQRIRCPVCGSHETKRLSTMNREVSVYVSGAASAKIGKQYQCKKCGHLW